MEPVILRHRDAVRQSLTYAAFAIVVNAVIITAFLLPMPGYWFTLVLLPVVVFLVYSSLRLATLKVRVDREGVWEPNPFRLTYVTPWEDIAHVRKRTSSGALHTQFVSVEIVHTDGDTHEVLALKMQGGAAYAEPTIEEWLDQIREAKKAAR
ncbi:MAG: hypothetical protein CVT64_07555 [Actinobacteria bacterium HGW-Actinobacteria-4]|nr:MAG: hypothetical protein CVT64_07555 [Actinobacteria bacterium HGW-Actinobacteria-4]